MLIRKSYQLFFEFCFHLNILWLEVDYGDFPLSSLEIFTVLYFRPKFIISFQPLCGVVCLRYFCFSLCVHVYRNAHTCLIRPEDMMALSSLSVSALVPWDKYLTERKNLPFHLVLLRRKFSVSACLWLSMLGLQIGTACSDF